MKIRQGFVTNSSSSSFIIGYNDINELRNELVERCYIELRDWSRFSDYTDGELKSRIVLLVNSYIEDSRVDKADFLKQPDLLILLLGDNNVYHYVCKGKALWDYDDEELNNARTQVGKFARNLVQKDLNRIYTEMKKYKHILYFDDVEDNSPVGCVLESSILPAIKGKIAYFNHH